MYKVGRWSTGNLNKVDLYTVEVKLNNTGVSFEIYTGCCLTVMNEKTSKKIWKHTKLPTLKPIKIKLETYAGDSVKVVGATFIKVSYKQQKKKLPLVVFQRGWA